jgi:very-short-patch-repair endonuclease
MEISNIKEVFIKKAKEKFGDKFDYSKVIYVNNRTKVEIICKEHGSFMSKPSNFLRGQGCPACSGNKKIDKEEFLRRAYKVHGDLYDYSRVYIINSKTKVEIGCEIHGYFKQTIEGHLKYNCPKCAKNVKYTKDTFLEKVKIVNSKYDYSNINFVDLKTKIVLKCEKHGNFLIKPSALIKGYGCNKCGCERRNETKTSNTETFIKKAIDKHGLKYDYSLVDYKKSRKKVSIKCNTCNNIFQQIPNSHLRGCGCTYCNTNFKKPTELFIEEANIIHKNKYDYSKVEYVSSIKKVIIICPIHGKFLQSPNKHTSRKYGCSNCTPKPKPKPIEEFIAGARKVHGDLFSYDKVEYVGNKKNVIIVCPKHGEFKQTPIGHLRGSGCPNCKNSKGEKISEKVLKKLGVEFIKQHKFSDCRNKRPLIFDFYIPSLNVAIEYDGQQHYKSVEIFGGQKAFKNNQHRDFIKNEYCKNKGIGLLRIKYNENIEDKIFEYFKNIISINV